MGATLSQLLCHRDRSKSNVPASPVKPAKPCFTNLTNAEILELWSDSIILASSLQHHQDSSVMLRMDARWVIDDSQDYLRKLLADKENVSPPQSSDEEILAVEKIPHRITNLLSKYDRVTAAVSRRLDLAHGAPTQHNALATQGTAASSKKQARRIDRAIGSCKLAKRGLAQLNTYESNLNKIARDLQIYQRSAAGVRFCRGLGRVARSKLDRDDRCVVCLEVYLDEHCEVQGPIVRLGCHRSHVFHLECACVWFRENVCCPFCRRVVLEGV